MFFDYRRSIHMRRTPSRTMCGYTVHKHPNRNFDLPTGRYKDATCRTCLSSFEKLSRVIHVSDVLEAAMLQAF
jgi:hypothetical protein